MIKICFCHNFEKSSNFFIAFEANIYLNCKYFIFLKIQRFDKVRAKGIRKIIGNVYVDNFAYDQNNIGPGWPKADLRFCYSAPINAILINQNCMPYVIRPSKRLGNRPIVSGSRGFGFLSFIFISCWILICKILLMPYCHQTF